MNIIKRWLLTGKCLVSNGTGIEGYLDIGQEANAETAEETPNE